MTNGGHRVDHDALFKELLQNFFQDFLVLFFPNIFEEIDFAHMKFLDKELVNDTQRRGTKELDVVVETKLKGEDSLIIVHVESQAQYQREFNERMFLYFSRLLEKHPGTRIIPVALFSYDDKNRQEPNTFEMSFPFLDVVTFHYLTVELNKLNWRDFIRKDNPVAGALLSKMGYNEDEKVEIKREFLRMLVRLELDKARNHLLTAFFETYLVLTEAEEQTLQIEINKLDPNEEERVLELMTSYEKKGMEKGTKRTICTYLNSRFGSLSNPVQEKIRTIRDIELLDKELEKIFAAGSLEAVERIIDKAKNQ